MSIRYTNTLGRVFTVHPNHDECFFLRIFLHTIKGPTSFESLKMVGGYQCESYRETCLKLELLENDQHWNSALLEAAISNNPEQIRNLFAIILTLCSLSNDVKTMQMLTKNLQTKYSVWG